MKANSLSLSKALEYERADPHRFIIELFPKNIIFAVLRENIKRNFYSPLPMGIEIQNEDSADSLRIRDDIVIEPYLIRDDARMLEDSSGFPNQ